MADDVLINKAATIERCVGRAREQYGSDPTGFALSCAISIIERHLDEFPAYSKALLLRDAGT